MARKNSDGQDGNADSPFDVIGISPGTPGQYGLGRYALGHDPLQENAEILSDKEIQDLLYDALAERLPALERADVAALVEDHVVTLKGQVKNTETKQSIAELAWSMPGVRDVHDQIGIAIG